MKFLPYYHFLFIVLIGLMIVSALPAISYAATQNLACPGNNDTNTYTDPNGTTCHSGTNTNNDTGFNVVEGTNGQATCGQVACPGDNRNIFRRGHTCIISTNGVCYAGTGPSGFNPTGCTLDPLAPNPVPCPKPMDLSIQVQDDANPPNPISGVTLSVTYEDAPPGTAPGKIVTATTGTNGLALIQGQLYSGDHFTIIPSAPGYVFEPNQYGNGTNLGIMEMNTLWSCGTPLGNGTTNDPCLFTAHSASAAAFPTPHSCTDCKGRPIPQAYYCTNTMTGQAFCSQSAFKPFSCQLCIPYTSPVLVSDITCSHLQGVCKPQNSCVTGQDLDSGELDCGTGNTCCSPLPYKPNLNTTLIVFGALALVGLFL